ncbi:MAG: thiaminase II, partial [Mycoplasma sp.]
KGIEDGTLDKEKFKFYIIQDYLYLQDYIRVFAIGVAKAKTLETMKLFNLYINIVLDGEMDIHKGYMGKFNFTQEEVDNTKPCIANLSYTSYMLRVAYDETEVEILVAILACAYSYELIAKQIIKNNPDSIKHEFYGEWIKGYASEQYSGGNVLLINKINELTKDYSEDQINHLIDVFVNCSDHEMKFWDMSWNLGK